MYTYQVPGTFFYQQYGRIFGLYRNGIYAIMSEGEHKNCIWSYLLWSPVILLVLRDSTIPPVVRSEGSPPRTNE